MVNSLIPLFTRFAAGCAENNFLGLVPWYHYLPASSFDGSCNVTSFTVLGAGSGTIHSCPIVSETAHHSSPGARVTSS